MLRVLAKLALSLLLLLAGPSLGGMSTSASSALEPPSTGGGVAVDRALQRLAVHRRMLMIGAHPDDEDNTLLTFVARELGGEAAYLSLSRGEGGQNLIGTELGEALGVLRTGELLAAREVEGSRQYFTRAYDFGYSKSLEETLTAWPHAELTEDVERVVRRFKPQVVVSIFPGDGRGRHGQHTAAGVMANELFERDGPDAFPQLEEEGLSPWTPAALYRRPWWNPEASDFELPLGGLDAATGRSVRQLAAASRSLHRSQDMGRLQPLGSRSAGLERVHGPDSDGPISDRSPAGSGTGLFDGIDTRLESIAEVVAEGTLRTAVRAELVAVRDLAESAREELSFGDPAGVLPALVEIARRLRGVTETLNRARVSDSDRGIEQALDFVEEKRGVASKGLLAAASVAIDAFVDREELVAGEPATVEVQVWNAGSSAVRWLATDERLAPGLSWSASEAARDGSAVGRDPEDGVERRRWTVEASSDAPPTLSYYLAKPRQGALYDWSEAALESRGAPQSRPPLSVRLELEVDGERLFVDREVVFRVGDQAVGEVRRPVRVVPALEVSLEPDLIVAPATAGEPIEVTVDVVSNVSRPIAGEVVLRPPPGWSVEGDSTFEIVDPRGRRTLGLSLRVEGKPTPGRYELRAVARVGEDRFAAALPVIDYPHIRPAVVVDPARAGLTVVDLALPKIGRVGYVRGAADRMPESLERVGLSVEILAGPALAEADLAVYDAIVIGPRAYEIDADLRESQPRLLRYLSDGGLLLVQYQQYQFVEGGYSAHALSIDRPHGRVTVEEAAVRVLETGHPVFRTPNRLDTEDWAGWVQERGLYFASEWDPALRPLLALADPGEEELHGSLLVGDYGDGTYVYTGLSFFRQLPAGIPGAYRLFANLLALAQGAGAETEDRRSDRLDGPGRAAPSAQSEEQKTAPAAQMEGSR